MLHAVLDRIREEEELKMTNMTAAILDTTNYIIMDVDWAAAVKTFLCQGGGAQREWILDKPQAQAKKCQKKDDTLRISFFSFCD